MTLEALEAHLPPDLRGPATTIARIDAGLSGAGVYRVEAAGRAYVLKVAAEIESPDDWHRTLQVQRSAAGAGLAPRIVHVDEPGRAVLTDFVADRSFMAFYLDPRTREAAIDQLGRTVRRIHALPLPEDPRRVDPRELLALIQRSFLAGFPLPGLADDAIRRVLDEAPSAGGRAPVVGHNDLNPTNLVYDGERILVLDWATAGPMDPLYDLAVLSVFLRMDEAVSMRLYAAYEGGGAPPLPDGFRSTRRLAATLGGAFQLFLARRAGHPGASSSDSSDTAPSLGDFYQRLRTGALKLGSAEGHWAFGLALLKESLVL